MLRQRLGLFSSAVLFALVATACSTAQQAEQTTTTTTSTTTTAAPAPPTLRLALVINETGPTASADQELETILTKAVEILAPMNTTEVELRTVSVEVPGQAQGAMASLINDGVSVVVTGCDDATVPAVIEAAVDLDLGEGVAVNIAK